MQFSELIPERGNRVFLSGMTGSGKSVLAKHFLAARNTDLVLIFDAKDEIKWTGYERFTSLKKLISGNPKRGIYAPNIHELNDEDAWDNFFKFAYIRQRENRKQHRTFNTIVYVDEAYAVTRGQEIPFYYNAGYTRGRSLGLEIWTATQRPKNIPQVLMSEAEHKYIFFHQMPQDLDKLEGTTGIPRETLESLSMERHEFIYANLNYISPKQTLRLGA